MDVFRNGEADADTETTLSPFLGQAAPWRSIAAGLFRGASPLARFPGRGAWKAMEWNPFLPFDDSGKEVLCPLTQNPLERVPNGFGGFADVNVCEEMETIPYVSNCGRVRVAATGRMRPFG